MTADTPDATAQAIAGRLSPAQKKALLWLPADGLTRSTLERHAPSKTTLEILSNRGLMAKTSIFHRGITPFGDRVRALLAAERDGGEVARG